MKNRKRNRMKGFDYSSNNIYFVTICVKNRVCCFGYVGTGRDLSVHRPENHRPENHRPENHRPENHRPENHHPEEQLVDLFWGQMNLNVIGEVVQAKIIWLQEQYKYVFIHNYVVMPNHVHIVIEIDSLNVKDSYVKIKSLSSLIGAFKTVSSKLIHQQGLESFAWQRSFHDHIIKNEKAYDTIMNYIDLNPQKWNQDTFYQVN